MNLTSVLECFDLCQNRMIIVTRVIFAIMETIISVLLRSYARSHNFFELL